MRVQQQDVQDGDGTIDYKLTNTEALNKKLFFSFVPKR